MDQHVAQAPRSEYAGGKMLAAVAEGVGRITFNQPEKRNAMSVEMWDGLTDILEAWGGNPSVRVVVLTGAGDKAFVSGADISQFAKSRSNAEAQKEYDKLTSAGRRKLAAFEKPVIARIQGFCLGGGLGIAMQADLRIASEGSAFGIPAAKLEHVFDRFYSERPAGEEFGRHSGLGLSISRQIVEALKGRIAAENRTDAEGRVAGARFVVQLPRG